MRAGIGPKGAYWLMVAGGLPRASGDRPEDLKAKIALLRVAPCERG